MISKTLAATGVAVIFGEGPTAPPALLGAPSSPAETAPPAAPAAHSFSESDRLGYIRRGAHSASMIGHSGEASRAQRAAVSERMR